MRSRSGAGQADPGEHRGDRARGAGRCPAPAGQPEIAPAL